MARIRTIKPEFPHSESVGRLSRDARLLFIQLWTICDDSGRARASSRMLASLLFPYDDDAPGLIGGWLDELEAEGCIRRYSHDGQQYLDIPNWLNHQKIDKPSASKFPAFAESSRALGEQSRKIVQDQGPRTKDQGEDQGSPSDLSPADAVDGQQDATRETIPCQAVVDVYNEVCADLFPAVAKLTDQRRKSITRAWNADKSNPTERARTNSLDYWRRYFGHCLTITFFRKAASGELSGEHVGWKPDFDFLIREKTWLGVLEGKYQ